MNAVDIQITSLSEKGCTPEEISDAMGLDIAAVKYSLLNSSKEFRKDNNKEKKEDITDEELEEYFRAYKDLALNCDNPFIKEKTLRFLIDEKKGRNAAKANFLPLNSGVNILLFNETIKKVKSESSKIVPVIEIAN